MSHSLLLRWSLRDLRGRWVLVTAIALIMAIGTALYTGLGSMETWRKRSNDASYRALAAHDVKVTLSEGNFVGQGRLRSALEETPGAGAVERAEERLASPTQLAARGARDETLASGLLVGGGRGVDKVSHERGAPLSAAGPGSVVLEQSFAKANDLPGSGQLRIGGGRRTRWIGTGSAPEHFLVLRPGGGDFGGGEASYGVVFAPLETAQRLAGRPGRVNELVVRLGPGGDPARFARDLDRTIARKLPEVAARTTTLAQDPVRRLLYKDAEGDQRIYNVFAVLVLLGAALATANLASRVVESQRREIGVGMALGVPPRELAFRPMLLGLQIAVLGTALGLGLGVLFAIPLRGALENLLPLPQTVTPFQPGVFIAGAALGFALPLVAVAWPVWRGVRVAPIDAIRVGFRSARGGGLAPLAERLRLPGGSPGQLPLRNLLRAPRRTAMTMLGIAAVIAVLVGLLGMIDSFLATVDISERHAAGRTPSRLNVRLDAFHALDSPVVERVRRTPGVAAVQPGAAVSGRVAYRGRGFPVSLELVDPGARLWAPEASEGELRPGRTGLMLTREAGNDLGARVGDEVTLRVPQRRGATEFTAVGVRMPVVALNPNPFRTFAYVDRSQAARLGLAGQTNQLAVLPESGRGSEELRRALFAIPGVVATEGVTDNAKLLDERLDDFVGVLRVVQAITLALALLIAFNSAAISLEERRREYATMFSFGMTVGRVVRLSVIEGAVAGIVATAAGVAFGVGVVGWVVHRVTPETFPELGVPVALSGSTVATAAVLGIAAVALAPLLSARKLRHMDVPSALRIVE